MRTFTLLVFGFILMLFSGIVYSWSVFRVEVETIYGASALQSGLPYMTSLFFYALSMVVTGRFLTLGNTRKITLIGALFIAAGWFLSAVSSSLLALTLSYGVFIGIGVGMIYGVPILILNQTSERSGLDTGIVLSGFGASPLVSAPLIHFAIARINLFGTFFALGLASILVLGPMILFLKSDTVDSHGPVQSVERPFSPRLFLMLYGLFFIATAVGLSVIGLTYRIGVVNYGFTENRVVVAMAAFALLNGIARPFFGFLVDRKGFFFAGAGSVLLMLLAAAVSLLNGGESFYLFAVGTGLFWFNLGAWLAMVPAAIKQFFGTTHYAKRYGLMFSAYGLGAIFGTVTSGIILDFYTTTISLYLAILAFVICILFMIASLKKQKRAIRSV